MQANINRGTFALFGAKPLFDSIRSTSNLVRPDFSKFLKYSQLFLNEDSNCPESSVEQLFDARLATFHNTNFCISFCSGFWGLVLATRSLALEGRKEVIMPSLTYRRLADIVAWVGLTPHFCEVDAQALCMTAETAGKCVNENTALILGVHPIVNCCDAEGLEALSAETEIPLLFDSVESAYETLNGRKVGSFGDAECFSVHASKFLNGFEGGYITTNNEVLATHLRALRNSGLHVGTGAPAWGMNAAQCDIHAAMALAALDGIEEQIDMNRRRYYSYQAGLAGIDGIRLVAFNELEQCGYKNIVVELMDEWPVTREVMLSLMHAENMLARAYYSPALHQRKVSYKTIWEDLSLTDDLSKRYLNLPCGYFVSENDVERICSWLRSVRTFGASLAE